jgi:hypothetical protein
LGSFAKNFPKRSVDAGEIVDGLDCEVELFNAHGFAPDVSTSEGSNDDMRVR